MNEIHATVWQDGDFWLIAETIDGCERMTQARNLREVPTMARDLAVCYGVADPVISLEFEGTEFDREICEYQRASAENVSAQARLAVASRKAVAAMSAKGLSISQMATLLGISRARVHQLKSSS